MFLEVEERVRNAVLRSGHDVAEVSWVFIVASIFVVLSRLFCEREWMRIYGT